MPQATEPNMEEEPEGLSWKIRPLRSSQIEEVAHIRKIYQWLEKAALKNSIDALIMAAQEQTLNTRSIEAGV